MYQIRGPQDAELHLCGIGIRIGQQERMLCKAKLSCGEGTQLTVGAVLPAKLTAELCGTEDCTNQTAALYGEAILEERRITLPLGSFAVTECSVGEERTTITAYDAAYYALSGDYVPDTEAPPTTALAVLRDVAAQCGLVLADTTGLTDQPVSEALTGYACREIVGYMSALLGCNAVIDRDGNLAFRWFAAGDSITPDDYYSGGLKLEGEQTLVGVRMTKKVTVTTTSADGITSETEQTTVYSAGTGTGLVIEVDNPFATQAIVDAVWAKIGALGTFRTGSCSYFGGIEHEPGDLLTVTDLQGVTSVLPVMGLTLELDGGCKATAEAHGESKTALSAGTTGPVSQLLSKIQADIAEFKELTADNFTAAVAKVNQLYADDAWVSRLFAQDITASGTITGVTLIGSILKGQSIDLGASEDDGAWVGDRTVKYSRLRQYYDDGESSYIFLAEICAGLPSMRRNQILLSDDELNMRLQGFAGGSYLQMTPGTVTIHGATGAHEYADGTLTLDFGNVAVSGTVSAYGTPLVLSNTTFTYRNYVAGFLANATNWIIFSVPLSRPLAYGATVTCTSLGVIVRHPDGGYPYARSGSNGATYTQLGNNYVQIWSNGGTVRNNEVTDIQCNNRTDSIRVQVAFVYALTKTSGNTAAVTNQVPVGLDINATFTIS